MNEAFKLNEAQVADFQARIKSLTAETIEKLAKAKDANGTFDVIISTEDVDRAGEIVRQDGWDFTNFKNNPVVLWGHDYHSLPIGVCTETYKTEVRGLPATAARGFFYPADINPFAQQVRKMYDLGVKNGLPVGCTTSVGFIPKEFDPNSFSVITQAELLEFSFVPVPANQGVGPAQGRALTFGEAKELGLDMPALRTKGIEPVASSEVCKECGKAADAPAEAQSIDYPICAACLAENWQPVKGTSHWVKKDAQAGDDCTMDDGTLGVLIDGNDGLVCQPKEAKSLDLKPHQKKLLGTIADEHTRHTGEIEKAIDTFTEASDPAEALKDLRDTLRDEQTLHRARSVDSFRGFNPVEDKTFNSKPHLKALREAHDAYEAQTTKLLEEFEGKSAKATAEEADELVDWLTAKFDESQRAHKKATLKLAKAMCRDAFGEEDEADEKTIEILKEFLMPHLDPQIANSVIAKVGSRISTETKKKLGEAHEHMKAASAVLEALHPGFADGDGEESRSIEVQPSPAPEMPRSRTRSSSRSEDLALKAHLQAREIVGGIEAVARAALGKLNAEVRTHSKK